MRILYVSPRECWPPTSGAHLRDYYLARAFAQHGEVVYLGFGDAGMPVWRGKQGPDAIESVLVHREPAYSASNIVRGLAGPLPVNVLNFVSARMERELRTLLDANDFDLVQMEGVHLISYIPVIRSAKSRPRLVCDWHNVESELMRRYAANGAASLPKRLYAARAARLLERLEDRLLAECDAHLVCSDRERDLLLRRAPHANIVTVPSGVDCAFQAAGVRSDSFGTRTDLVFVGSMEYHANIDGALYFANEIWPRIHDAFPHLRFLIVGSRPVPEVRALEKRPGVVVTGTVDDVRPYYRNALAAVVPLRVGSGTRLKILEAMASGVPVISTRLGAEGLQVTPNRDILLADTPQEFESAVRFLAGDDAAFERVARAGAETARATYDWSQIGEEVYAFYSRFSAAKLAV